MQVMVNSATFMTGESTLCPVSVYGYSSNSVPGIDIVGLDKKSKLIKETISYLLRLFQLKLPLKRYVLVINEVDIPIGRSNVHCLELPLLLSLLVLSRNLGIHRLDDCFAIGEFALNGRVREPMLNIEQRNSIYRVIHRENDRDLVKLISNYTYDSCERVQVLSLNQLLEDSRLPVFGPSH